ncbi:hypothetical protein, partial [Nocardioides sp.]|uniref:hypothetical protein n=1 Tax=Nocardioides sp. TaxID=35761 RepID=UPI0025E5ADB5
MVSGGADAVRERLAGDLRGGGRVALDVRGGDGVGQRPGGVRRDEQHLERAGTGVCLRAVLGGRQQVGAAEQLARPGRHELGERRIGVTRLASCVGVGGSTVETPWPPNRSHACSHLGLPTMAEYVFTLRNVRKAHGDKVVLDNV